MNTATATRTVSLHALALEASAVPGEADHAAAIANLVGRTAVYTTAEGEELVGTIEAPTRYSSGYPVVRFADGRWGRCDDAIVLVL